MNHMEWRDALKRLHEDPELMDVAGGQMAETWRNRYGVTYARASVEYETTPCKRYQFLIDDSSSYSKQIITVPLDLRRRAMCRSQESYDMLVDILTPIMREWKIARLLK